MDNRVLEQLPTFVLVFFRVAGLALTAPLLGSAILPRQIKVLLALILALGLTPGVAVPVAMPHSAWELSLGIGGELVFGAAMGLCLNLVFIAVAWAGQFVGQQLGLNLGEVFDPATGTGGSVVGDLYFLLAMVVFLIIRGHHLMIAGIRGSFDALPLLSVGMNKSALDLLLGLLTGATVLAVQLAAPIFVTMLVVDMAMGFIGKTIPQINVLTAGLSLKPALGILVVALGLVLSSATIRSQLTQAMGVIGDALRNTGPVAL